ncbi:MAG: hypothetical protein Q8Q46_01070 [Candidatus Giovannonibacteria bacterium]|nr:hypothetical protein [Candidatus Giovannonibacteria bacterium]
MNLLNNKKPFWALGLGLIIFVFFIFLGWFIYGKIKQSSMVSAEAEGKIALLEKKEREFSLAESNLKDFGQEINLLDGAFLSEGTFVDFLRLLESLARKTGVKFSAQNAKLPQLEKEIANLNFEITGNFRGVADFFALLDKIPYAGIVDNANISPKAEGQKKTGEVTARINYIIFNFKI